MKSRFNPPCGKSPCMGCNERHPGCHDGCEKYHKYVDANDEVRLKKAEYEFNLRFLSKPYIRQQIEEKKRKRKKGETNEEK